MRRYDDVIEVRRGLVAGQEAPEQFLWRHRLWLVRDVLAYWVETGAWWERPAVGAVLGWTDPSEQTGQGDQAGQVGQTGSEPGRGFDGPRWGAELLAEREVWRVEAGRGRHAAHDASAPLPGAGVFELAFDWSEARWRLVGCAD